MRLQLETGCNIWIDACEFMRKQLYSSLNYTQTVLEISANVSGQVSFLQDIRLVGKRRARWAKLSLFLGLPHHPGSTVWNLIKIVPNENCRYHLSFYQILSGILGKAPQRGALAQELRLERQHTNAKSPLRKWSVLKLERCLKHERSFIFPERKKQWMSRNTKLLFAIPANICLRHMNMKQCRVGSTTKRIFLFLVFPGIRCRYTFRELGDKKERLRGAVQN